MQKTFFPLQNSIIIANKSSFSEYVGHSPAAAAVLFAEIIKFAVSLFQNAVLAKLAKLCLPIVVILLCNRSMLTKKFIVGAMNVNYISTCGCIDSGFVGLVTAATTTMTWSDGLGVVVGGGRLPMMVMEKLIEIYRFPITFIHFPSWYSSPNSWGHYAWPSAWLIRPLADTSRESHAQRIYSRPWQQTLYIHSRPFK